ncbi:cobalamin biosynthesis protein [[Mycobacterium] wendilense]|uniref:Cobalamin biosynthesis protein CobD n=1 Tax=[Mycobacterium] wendilense TaxID=3064284 RepID=A0ABN9P116_9MYCO|nr:cobalamin biosynthesis protein [Mycolicibacterium sp. MU0050]CAJ1582073.1 cobalamin biosynthesis protein [Mycolicibacterium sp. MU0050]
MNPPRTRARVAGVLLGYLADLTFADPRRAHPVAGFGGAAVALERLTYRDNRIAGAAHVAILLGGLGLSAAWAARHAGRQGTTGTTAAVAAATWVALGGTSLARTGTAMADLLDAGDLDGARALLPSLCGRDPQSLDADGLTRAALESVAENTSDAQVAPVLWAAVGAAPAVLLYRGANTLDAMVGHRSPRYARFGWAAARLDDAANYLAARVAGALTVVCAPLVGGSAAGAARAWRRDARRHPSPNAGVVEAAFAGALGVQLGGPTRYRHELQLRPTLGDGPGPGVADLRRGVALSRCVQGAAALTAAALAGLSGAGRTGRRVCPRR